MSKEVEVRSQPLTDTGYNGHRIWLANGTEWVQPKCSSRDSQSRPRLPPAGPNMALTRDIQTDRQKELTWPMAQEGYSRVTDRRSSHRVQNGSGKVLQRTAWSKGTYYSERDRQNESG